MTTRRQKLVISLIAWIPVLVLMALSVVHVIGQYRRVVDNASDILVEELSRRLNREVKIGSATVTPFGVAVLRDVEIAAETKLVKGLILEASEVRIKYDVGALVLNKKGAQSIASVLVIDPRIYLVRRKDGSLNIQDLLKRPPGPPGPPFEGTVEIQNATLVFTDYLAKTKSLPAVNIVQDLQGFLDAADQPIYRFRGSGRGAKNKFRVAKVVGNYNIRSKRIDLDLDATDVSAAYWSRYLGLSKSLSVQSGTLRVIAGIRVTRPAGKTRLSLSGAAKISDASVLLPTMIRPVTNVNGTAALSGQNVILSVTGNVANSKMRARGTVSGFRKPKIDMLASSPNADFASFVRAFKLPKSVQQLKASGRGPVIARFTGLAGSPTIAARASVPRVTVSGYTARNVEVSGTYSKGLLSVSSARFNLDGARVTASGSISTSGRQNVSISGQAAGIDLGALPLPREWQAKGTGSAGFTITGTVANPNILASVNIAKGEFRGISIQRARAQVSFAQGRYRVAGLEVVSKAFGRVVARGEISRRGVNLSVTGESVNLAALGRIAGIPNLSGTGYFTGTVRGPLRAPVFSGTFEAFAAQYDKYKFDYARLVFHTNMKTVTVESGVVRLFPAEFKFSGAASGIGTDRVAFNVSGQVDRLTVGRLSSLLGRRIDATGTLVGSFDAAGIYLVRPASGQSPLQNTVASAEFRLEDGTAFGYPVTDAVARFTVLDNRLEVSEAVLTSQDAKATLSGSAFLDTGAIDLKFEVLGFDLVRLRDFVGKYAVVGGIARAEGTVTGTLGSPIVAAGANIDNLIVNYSKFDVAEVNALYVNGLVESVTATLKKGAQVVSLQAKGYDLATNCLVSATGSLENVSVPELWNTFRASPYLRSESGAQIRESLARVPRLTSGVLNGTFSMSGCMSHPDGALKLVATNVGIETGIIDSIVLDADASGGIVTLDQLRATAGTTSLIASGTYEIGNRQVQIDITASNLDLSRLRPWLGESTPGGTMAADFVVRGDIGSPSVIGSVEVVKPSFAGLTFDALRASRIEVMQDRIEFADVILAAGSHQAIAQGYVPWSWSSLSIPTDRPVEMVARLMKQDLSVLASFSSMVDLSGTGGSVEAMLEVKGTLENPVLDGSLIVENGTVALRNFGNQFNNINVNVSFDGDRIVVNQFSLASSLGGTLSIVPGGYVAIGQDAAAEANLLIVANGLSIIERNALGMQEEVSLQLDAGLSVTGDPRAPLVTNANVGSVPGGISIHDARIVFVSPEVPKSRPLLTPPINPTFDVAIRIGENVVIAPPTMTLTVTGEGSVSGSLAQPALALDMTIQEGSLRLAVSRLTVVTGGKLYVRYSPPLESEVRVDLQASTTVMAMNSLGARERHVITVSVKGPVSNLEIDLSSTPADLSEEQMLAALGHVSGIFAGGEAGLQNELGNILTAVGTSTIFAPVESIFVEQFGFEQFSLEYALGQPLAIYASRRLWGNFFISYYGVLTSNFTSPNDVAYLLGLGYRFGPKYQITMFVDNMQNGSFQMQYTQAFW